MAFRQGITSVLCILALLCLTHDSVLVSGGVRCVGEERESLQRFKQGIIDYYGFLTYWWRSEDCCDWARVVCSNTTDHVVALHLSDLALQGQLNPSLLGLHYLADLDLSGNYFYGRVPEFIGSMKQLQFLNLSNSYFFGETPPQLGNLTNLVSLDLSLNRNLWSDNLDWLSSLSLLSRLNMSDSNLNTTSSWLLPILKLPSLQELSLRYCGLGDVVLSPAFFVNSSLPSLTTLDLSGNMLTSSAFDWLFNMSTSLVTLILGDNVLNGTIPDRFGRFVSLEYLDLWHNYLEGEIPKSLGNLSHLKILSLCRNLLEGTLEGLFGNESCSLEIVGLSINGFTGPIPDMAACSSLRYLIVFENNLSGRVPESIGELAQLEILDASFNSLEGAITEANFRSLHELKVLALSFNSLILQISPDWNPPFQSIQYISLARCQIGPSFPKWIQTQSKLAALDLSSNAISNEIPEWYFYHSRISLNLSTNQINGTLPDLSKTNLFDLDVSSNNISGPLPLLPPNVSSLLLSDNKFSGSAASSICRFPLVNLALLDLSHNLLVGELPTCLERLINLMYLNLAHNNFSGEIPHHLGSLQSLRTLHLRDNNLSGEFPSSLSHCKYIQLIDVGGNKLTGNISWIGSSNYTYLNYLLLGQNRFDGSIPAGICDFTSIRILDLSRNNFSGQIPDCFNNFASMGDNATFIPFVGTFGFLYYYLPIGISHPQRYVVENTFVQWKGQEAQYRRTLGYLKLIDLSSNGFVGRIPRSLSTLKGLISLNLSRNSFTGNIIPDAGRMTNLECLDLSSNHLSGIIPTSLAELTLLSVLDLSNNNLYGKIPSSTQLQSFTASAYAGNLGLCGIPLTPCVENGSQSINHHHHSHITLSFMQEVFISMTSGFVIGFWGIVGSLVLNKLWRRAYFSFWDNIGRWAYVNTAILLNKFKPR